MLAENGEFIEVCCDTSYLYSLYARDAHSPRAEAIAARLEVPVSISPFNEYELLNAMRTGVFRRVLSVQDAAAMRANYEADLASDVLVLVDCDLAAVLAEANRLSAAHTQTGGYRAFDVLHVAAALHLGAGEFLSFDNNQRALAVAEGLAVNP